MFDGSCILCEIYQIIYWLIYFLSKLITVFVERMHPSTVKTWPSFWCVLVLAWGTSNWKAAAAAVMCTPVLDVQWTPGAPHVPGQRLWSPLHAAQKQQLPVQRGYNLVLPARLAVPSRAPCTSRGQQVPGPAVSSRGNWGRHSPRAAGKSCILWAVEFRHCRGLNSNSGGITCWSKSLIYSPAVHFLFAVTDWNISWSLQSRMNVKRSAFH